LMALGRRDRTDSAEPFNMAYLAVRGSGAVNGVSQLHGQVSRGIFQVLFPRWPEIEVPVTHVTNGVHTPTWDSVRADDLWEGAWRLTSAQPFCCTMRSGLCASLLTGNAPSSSSSRGKLTHKTPRDKA